MNHINHSFIIAELTMFMINDISKIYSAMIKINQENLNRYLDKRVFERIDTKIKQSNLNTV